MMALLDGMRTEICERVRPLHSKGFEILHSGEFVLYCMFVAVRNHENPALEVACYLSELLRKPLMIVHELREDDPFASDRQFAFAIQGAMDFAKENENLNYIFSIKQKNSSSLQEYLCKHAAVVVLEDCPVPTSFQLQSKAIQVLKNVLLVDSSCILPVEVVGRAYDRAYLFRLDTQEERMKRISLTWPNVIDNFSNQKLSDQWSNLGSDQFNLKTMTAKALYEWLRRLDIDHSVVPVFDTIGGSAAGYARWREFICEKISTYASDRNEPLKNRSSRMSPYLRLGHVSPFTLARDAHNFDGLGSEKFLDELLIWRELSYALCRFKQIKEFEQLVPTWALESLKEHEADFRLHKYSWETLAHAKTHDELWNAAQLSLIQNGELHNNLRMTWGKAVLNWTSTAKDAYDKLVDLNNRFALDGGDPSSYGGILWCFGQFDRPFLPAQPIYGQVRTRPLEEHSKRLNARTFEMVFLQKDAKSIAIVGSGFAGLACARQLQRLGHTVTVFEQNDEVGGRLRANKMQKFDTGAQSFTVRTDVFNRYVSSWMEDGLVSAWKAKGSFWKNGNLQPINWEHKRYFGVFSMSYLAAHLADDLAVRFGEKVLGYATDGQKFRLIKSSNEECFFDAIVFAITSPEASKLLGISAPSRSRLMSLHYRPCITIIIEIEGAFIFEFDSIKIEDEIIQSAVRQNSKGNNSQGNQIWALEASHDWTEAHFDEEDAIISESMVRVFRAITAIKINHIQVLKTVRWKEAKSQTQQGEVIVDNRGAVVFCGDWALLGNLEGAFLSGINAAAIVNSFFHRVPLSIAKKKA